jgi:MFS family permease
MTIKAGAGTGPVVWALGLTQIIGYGTLYYSFGTLAPAMAAEFGWPTDWVFGALSASLLIGGLVAPISGRLADRYGAARLMSIGSLAAALSLVLAAVAPNGLAFVAGLVAMEVASASVLYATAFAALAQVSPTGAQRSITHLTLIAGFASTIFWPITSALHDMVSWREVYLIYAAVNLLVCVPVHHWLATAQRRRTTSHAHTQVVGAIPAERQSAALVLMLAGFALVGLVSSAVTVHMMPMLAGLGAGTAAGIAATLFGPSQVLSRLVNMQFGKGLSQPMLAIVASAVLPLALVVLLLGATWGLGAAGFAILFGIGNGLYSIVSGTLPLTLFGSHGYGRRLGLVSAARLLASAGAPVAFSVLATIGSTATAVAATAGIGIVALGVFVALHAVAGRPMIERTNPA